MTLSKLYIVNALVWAAMMIAIALMIGDSDLADGTRQTILFIQIAGWLVTSAAIQKLEK